MPPGLPAALQTPAQQLNYAENIDLQSATITLDAAELPVGEYRVIFELAVEARELADTLECGFTRVERLPERKVYVDEHQRLIADGHPCFPLGMYWRGIKGQEESLKEYADSPFNCLMPYRAPTPQQMDLCQSHNLKVIYSIKDIYSGTRWAPASIKTLADEERFIAEKVATHANHPALLAWYINDERPLDMLERLTARQRLMERLDPSHPTWVVLDKYDSVDLYLPTFDIIGTDPYPIPNRSTNMALKWSLTTRALSGGHRAMWQVPQVFDWGGYRKGEAREKTRPPTLREMRSMAWNCIAAGANGLIFYSYFDLHKMHARTPFEERWSEVCQMAAEIKELIPVMLSVAKVPGIKVRGAPEITTRLWCYGEELYLLAVSGSDEPVVAQFELPRAISSFRVRFGDAPALSEDRRTLSTTMHPMEPLLLIVDY